MKPILLLSFSGILLFSCKKDKVPPVIDGNFLCEVVQEYNYTNDNSDTFFDYVYALEVENDSIYFYNYAFPLASYDINEGSGTHTIDLGPNRYVRLTMADHFDKIDFYGNFPSQLAGPSTSISIIGDRTEFTPTTDFSTPLNVQSGTYQLYQQVFENYNGIDHDTTANAIVHYDSQTHKIVVEGVSRPFPLCHSHYSKISSYTGNFIDKLNTQVYFANDSLYYHYHHTTGPTWPASDTAHYHFQGSKL